jgi:isopenicillin-N N-acyltransferase like protein
VPSGVELTVDAGDAFERGRQRGRQVADRLHQTWPIYRRLFAATAREALRDPVDVGALADSCAESVATWSPDLFRELEGVAAGSGFDLHTVLALNARTEVLAFGRGCGTTECSTLVQMEGPDGSAISAQTWDWHHDLSDGWHVQTVRGDEHTFVGLTEFGMLAKIGVNDAGLAVHFNLLRHASDVVVDADGRESPPGGIPVHLLAREVLGKAGSLAAAVELIRSAPAAASTVITVVTPDEAACVEISPAGVGVVEPADGWLVHANHFLDPQLAEGERVTLDVTTTFERQELLRSRVKGVAGPLDGEGLTGLLRAHDEDGVAVCRHLDPAAPFGYRSATLATVAVHPARRSVAVSAWGPCRGTDVTTLCAAVR